MVNFVNGYPAKFRSGVRECAAIRETVVWVDREDSIFAPGIYDFQVVTRVSEFAVLSRDCIAAWTVNRTDANKSNGTVTIRCRWRGMQADITVPFMTPQVEISFASVNWEVCRTNNNQDDMESQSPYKAPMRNCDAENRVRDHLESSNFLTKIGSGELSHGCFIDRENRDMFIDNFLRGSFQPPVDFMDVRQRLGAFSYGRQSVTFGIAMYSDGACSEIRVWRKKKSVYDSVRSWWHRMQVRANLRLGKEKHCHGQICFFECARTFSATTIW